MVGAGVVELDGSEHFAEANLPVLGIVVAAVGGTVLGRFVYAGGVALIAALGAKKPRAI